MNTTQYPDDLRKQYKLDQRTPAYRELQKRAAEDRLRLETLLRERNATIAQLKEQLAEAQRAA
jgi:hypothetical protein